MWYGQVNNYSVQIGGETKQIAATGETQVYDSEGGYLGKTFYLVDGSSLWVPHEDLAENPVVQVAEEASVVGDDAEANAENVGTEDTNAELGLAQENEGDGMVEMEDTGAETEESESANAEMFGGEGVGGE